jgi:FtsP/CotA-like multicopper oxidase with cupredoxin domain
MTTARRLARGSKRKALLGLLPLACTTVALILLWPSAASTAPDPIGMECSAGNTVSLETATGHASTPDGNGIFMWGYKLAGGSFQMPGPTICVTQGQTVTVNLTNTLSEPVSIVFPGQENVVATGGSPGLLTDEAAASGGTVSYSFTAGQPGTYLYESGSNPEKQVQMGLYGALVVRPSLGANYAYNDASTEFDPNREYLLVLNEIDPALHRAVELGRPYDFSRFNDDYWQVNGRSFPDTIAENFAAWLPTQPYGALVQVEPCGSNSCRALIRYANAGEVNHPFHPHGNHLRVIARDGRLLRGPGGEDASYEDFTRTIGSGQTYDLLFRWTNVDAWVDPGGDPVPVQIPGLQNLVFKDDTTFYSGDPELGEQDELPVGVTSFNQCGEFYFPWHSHALFEFTNFDEGFGGLATLLRVDPPGGCAP